MSMTFAEQERILRKNTGMLPRSWEEATRNADYATPLWRTKTTWERTVDNLALGFLMSALFSVGIYLGYAIGTN